jgi:hypothetical protein
LNRKASPSIRLRESLPTRARQRNEDEIVYGLEAVFDRHWCSAEKSAVKDRL